MMHNQGTDCFMMLLANAKDDKGSYLVTSNTRSPHQIGGCHVFDVVISFTHMMAVLTSLMCIVHLFIMIIHKVISSVLYIECLVNITLGAGSDMNQMKLLKYINYVFPCSYDNMSLHSGRH